MHYKLGAIGLMASRSRLAFSTGQEAVDLALANEDQSAWKLRMLIVRMRIGTYLIAAMTGVSLPALGQFSSNTNNAALADCVRAADQKYKDTWDTLCIRMGKGSRCVEFVGSPRDREFSQLRIEEMTLCSKLYGR